MNNKTFEAIIAYHCAPALSGIKPSNIVSLQKTKIADINGKIAKFNQDLNRKNIYIQAICECKNRVLAMVYRRSVLENHLNAKENREFLSKYGYDKNGSFNSFLEKLKTRLTYNAFPHEIGVFLGYPLCDIHAFINHRDKGCLLCGEWKVYHNPELAKRTFYIYGECRRNVCKKIQSGKTLAQIFHAA